MSGYQPLPRLHDNDTVPNTDDSEDKDEYEYVIEKGCFPKHRKVLSYNASIFAVASVLISLFKS